MGIAYAAEEGIAIHLAPPIVGHLWGVPITSTLITAWLTILLLITATVFFRRRIVLIPNKIQIVIESLVDGAYKYMESVLENAQLTRRYFPVVMTIFIFVLAQNWLGLLPGVDAVGFFNHASNVHNFTPYLHPANTDLNMTIALAIVASLTIEIAGVLAIGFWKYTGKFINFSSPLAFLIGIIELCSELARLISFSFRLFGNIFAGKTLILVVIFFVPFVLPVPILAFELFVGIIQAFIFAVLTLFFIKLAVEEPH
jgi:F-type H+-transporting ATPase subunit a